MFKKIDQEIKFEIGSIIVSSLPLLYIISITIESKSYLFYTPIMIYIAIHLTTLHKYDVRKILKTYNETNIYNGLAGRLLLSLIPLAQYIYNNLDQAYYFISYSVPPALTLIEPLIYKKISSEKTIITENFTKKTTRILSIKHIITWHIILAITCTVVVNKNPQPSFILESILFIEAIILAITFKIIKSTAKETKNHIYENLRKLRPKFALYFAAPYGSEFQVKMWIMYLERINLPFIIILRQAHMLSPIKKMTKAPIFLCNNITSLDSMTTDSLTTCFYVNNGMHNMHMVRYSHICHIQLLHGDSDKSASYNPVTAMYDKIFVAGQAGIDRYLNNKINIPIEKFKIVGRPQVEQIEVSNFDTVKETTILYAPTWRGYYQDLNFSSISIAEKIIKRILKEKARVIFRPHPYSYKSESCKKIIKRIQHMLSEDLKKNNNSHIYGHLAEKQMSVFDCFNNCDAMISDVSSVVADFLYSEKPFIVVNMNASCKDPEEQFPLTKAGYILNQDLSNLDFAINELLYTDSKKEQRRSLKSYYLGEFNKENYAENFIKISKKIITKPEGF